MKFAFRWNFQVSETIHHVKQTSISYVSDLSVASAWARIRFSFWTPTERLRFELRDDIQEESHRNSELEAMLADRNHEIKLLMFRVQDF